MVVRGGSSHLRAAAAARTSARSRAPATGSAAGAGAGGARRPTPSGRARRARARARHRAGRGCAATGCGPPAAGVRARRRPATPRAAATRPGTAAARPRPRTRVDTAWRFPASLGTHVALDGEAAARPLNAAAEARIDPTPARMLTIHALAALQRCRLIPRFGFAANLMNPIHTGIQFDCNETVVEDL